MPIGRAIRLNAEREPGRPAVTCGAATITRSELDRRSNRLARAYAAMGVERDDLVTVALPNGVAFFEACAAIWKLGATPQPVSARLPAAELEAIVELARPPIVVGAAMPGVTCVPQGFEPADDISDEPLPEVTARSFKAPTSGGSTGRPKIIVSGNPGTTQALIAAFFQIGDDETVLIPGPLYHNAPFMFGSIALFAGNHVVVMPRFDAAETMELLERYKVTWTWLVPTMMQRIWRLPERERDRDLSALRIVYHGAAPCPDWLKEAWIGWLGPHRVWELYAGTEAQAVSVISGEEWLAHRGSVGRPLVGEMRVFGPDGAELPPGEVGEIFMLRPDPASPTYRYIGAEARSTDDGWESIGDMGWKDADGYVYLADRRTDLILSGGANVYPAEVEAALSEHPLVRTCAVIGLPDEDLGQRVHALVQTDGDVSDEELGAFLAQRIVRYKIPRSFERVDHALRDEAGKVRRGELREQRLGAGAAPEAGGPDPA